MVDIPVELFFGFIGMSVVLLVIGLIREPKIPATVVFAGMFMLTITMLTDNITFGSRIDNIVATESTFNITGSVTEIPDYKYNVITGTQALVIRVDGANVHGRGEHITANSVLVGEIIECINLPILKTGSPTGTADIGIMDTNNAIIKLFGQIDVSTLTTTFTYYEFCLPDGESYTLLSDTYVELRWVTGTSDVSNNISVLRDNSNVFDGTNTVSSAFTTVWTDTTTADNTFQMYSREGIPNNIQVSGIGGIYSYEPDSFPFTELPKVIFAFFSVILMLLGALLTKMGMG